MPPTSRIRVQHLDNLSGVVAFYDTHPINEDQILHSLETRGIRLEQLTEEILKDFDQDHYGGVEANDLLAAKARMQPHHRVLDVCSGMGGPARYLAHRIGCRVTGLDLTETRVCAAIRLTQLTRQQRLVDFRLGNALDMPFKDSTFDIVIGQEAWAHVPDKSMLITQCVRVLKPAGVIAFTDILRTEKLSTQEMERLTREMTFPNLETLDGYSRLLKENGCEVTEREDLGPIWAQALRQRLEMYRSLKDDTETAFGAEHFRKWDETYAFFVALYGEGKLTGGRFIARRSG